MSADISHFSPGALVRARERDWIVVPEEESNLIRLRPVDGADDDAIGIFVSLEKDALRPSQYPIPNPTNAGDFTGALLLRDAIRLMLRSGAGPFRSMGRLSVTPRPYQFVPLIMALRMDPVRLLIADDVGVGKTIEAAMIARELLDRGIIRRIGVLCAPHLCEQWAEELRNKFNIEAAVIQPSYIARLERDLPRGDIGIYQYYRHLVVSIDYVKSEKNRRMFIDNAPDLIIIDEAHTAARPRGDKTSSQHQRYSFLKELVDNSPKRHLMLVTATPHSGIEESFRSLLGLLDPSFDQPGEVDVPHSKLLPYLIQRRRKDLENWLGEGTPFPKRDSEELSYNLSPEYMKLFEDVLAYCRESISAGTGLRQQQQRVRYWAAIAILRCVLSSPKAAEVMLSERAKRKENADQRENDDTNEQFSAQILDSVDEAEPSDYIPSAPLDDPNANLNTDDIRKLNRFLNTAIRLAGCQYDKKLAKAAGTVDELLSQGYHPIVYCRFIATAEYVAEQLQSILRDKYPNLRVVSVTGDDGDSEQRKERVDSLANEPVRVLVATECLSEGINLQEHFDAVVHYDLPWNPNRLEQREGRVDRYGQKRPVVKTVLIYGGDNPIDLTVLDVLIRKAKVIRQRLGISVPVPVDSQQVIQAVIDSVLLRQTERGRQLQLAFSDPKVSGFHAEWDKAAEREDKARTFFAQYGIKPNEVAQEIKELDPVLGNAQDIHRFVANAVQRFNGSLRPTSQNNVFQLHPGDLQLQMQARAPILKFPLLVAFTGIPPEGVTLLGRNHPVVATLADTVLAQALSSSAPQFARCGAIYTNMVTIRTPVLVLRLRYLLQESTQQYAEEVVVAAFKHGAQGIEWLKPLQEEGLRLLSEARVTTNIPVEERQRQVAWALDLLRGAWYETIVRERVSALESSHKRLRTLIKASPLKVTPHTPPDILGCYVLVPSGGGI